MSQIVVNFISLFDLHPRILNMQTCLLAFSTTLKLPALTAGKDTSTGPGLCQIFHACLPLSFIVSWRGCGSEYTHAQFSRVYLPSTCDITHVITYTKPFLSLILFFGKGSRGRPGDEAT